MPGLIDSLILPMFVKHNGDFSTVPQNESNLEGCRPMCEVKCNSGDISEKPSWKLAVPQSVLKCFVFLNEWG